jgi:membrane complex biogenesis BtpA family protein
MRERTGRTEKLFDGAVIGMVHLLPLPGSPGHRGMEALVEAALRDADALLEGGADALLVENMHDFPCLREREMGPEVAAAMTRAACALRRRAGPARAIGVQVLFAANRTAVAVAAAADLDFIRAEGWTYGHLADKGWVEASAGSVVRYRKALEAEGLLVLADVKKKHASHAATADLSLAETAANLDMQAADAVVVTGPTTGVPPAPAELEAVAAASSLPVVVGSGLTAENAAQLAPRCRAAIVGTSLKQGGDWRCPVDAARVARFVEAFRAARVTSP